MEQTAPSAATPQGLPPPGTQPTPLVSGLALDPVLHWPRAAHQHQPRRKPGAWVPIVDASRRRGPQVWPPAPGPSWRLITSQQAPGPRHGRVSSAQRRRPLPRHCAGRRRERACAAVCAARGLPSGPQRPWGLAVAAFPERHTPLAARGGSGPLRPALVPHVLRPLTSAAASGTRRLAVDVTRLSVAEGVGQPPGCPWAPAWDARVQSPLPLPSAPSPRCREGWASSGPLRALHVRPVPARCL